jgi:hypothetical protein
VKKYFIALCLLFCLFSYSHADTHIASSACYADVNTAVVAATAGDTIQIPPVYVSDYCYEATYGSANWSTNKLTTTKSLKFIGAGSGLTIISGSGVTYSGLFTLTARSTFEMSGIKWISTASYSINGNILGTIIAAESGWRIHDNIFTYIQAGTNGFGMLMTYSNIYSGLIDHNTSNLVQFAFSGYTITDAQSMWQLDAQWGTGEAVFLENNSIYGGYAGSQYPELVQSRSGSRLTIRYNDFYDAAIQCHSACESTIRGTRSYEVYNNYYHNTHNSFNFYVQMRAGSLVATRNKVAGTWWSSSPGRVHFDNRRSQFDSFCTGWGGACDGDSAYDGNSANPAHGNAVDGWACIDQTGRGKQTGVMGSGGTQASDPAYVWGNVTGQICLSGTAKYGECDTAGGITACTGGGGTCSASTLNPNAAYLDTANNSSYHIVADRDYFLSEKAGYTIHTCPHPLADPSAEGSCTTDAYGIAGYTLTGGGGDVTAPTCTWSIDYTGLIATGSCSEPVDAVTKTGLHFDGSVTGAITATYKDGMPGANPRFDLGSEVQQLDVVTGTYAHPVGDDGIKDLAGNALADGTASVTNNSTQVTPPTQTLTITAIRCTVASAPSAINCTDGSVGTCTTAYDTDTSVVVSGFCDRNAHGSSMASSIPIISGDCNASTGEVSMSGAKACTLICTKTSSDSTIGTGASVTIGSGSAATIY